MAPGRKVANMSDYALPAVKSVRHWAGQWIWVKGEAKPRHFYLYARRAFELAAPARSALLRVTAADRYVLYINGVYVGRGPARSDPRRKSYDTYQVAQHLAPGANVVAIRALSLRYPRAWGRRLGRLERQPPTAWASGPVCGRSSTWSWRTGSPASSPPIRPGASSRRGPGGGT